MREEKGCARYDEEREREREKEEGRIIFVKFREFPALSHPPA